MGDTPSDQLSALRDRLQRHRHFEAVPLPFVAEATQPTRQVHNVAARTVDRTACAASSAEMSHTAGDLASSVSLTQSLVGLLEGGNDTLSQLVQDVRSDKSLPGPWRRLLEHEEGRIRRLEDEKRLADLVALYSHATRSMSFAHKAHPDFVAVWTSYARLQGDIAGNDGRSVFKYMKNQRIGANSRLFYEEWAALERRLGNADKAESLEERAQSLRAASGEALPAKMASVPPPPPPPPSTPGVGETIDADLEGDDTVVFMPKRDRATESAAKETAKASPPPDTASALRSPARPPLAQRAANTSAPDAAHATEPVAGASAKRVGFGRKLGLSGARRVVSAEASAPAAAVSPPEPRPEPPRGPPVPDPAPKVDGAPWLAAPSSPAMARMEDARAAVVLDVIREESTQSSSSSRNSRKSSVSVGDRTAATMTRTGQTPSLPPPPAGPSTPGVPLVAAVKTPATQAAASPLVQTPAPAPAPAVPATALAGKASDDVITVNGHRYHRLGLIGRGGTSKVFRVMDPVTKDILALKRVRFAGQDRSFVDNVTNEIELLRSLQGVEGIIRLIDAEIDWAHETVFLVMEHGDIDLATLLQRQQGKPFNLNFVGLYWQQMLTAVHGLHEARVVHSDLKPANFLSVQGSLKLIDFGIAKAISNDTTNIVRDDRVGTVNFMSPESISGMGDPGGALKVRGGTSACLRGPSCRSSPDGLPARQVGRASDIWSLGCILYAMVYGQTPFAHITNILAKLRAITDPKYTIHFPPAPNGHLLDVMQVRPPGAAIPRSQAPNTESRPCAPALPETRAQRPPNHT